MIEQLNLFEKTPDQRAAERRKHWKEDWDWDGIDERASMEVLCHSDHKVHRKHYTEVTEDRIRRLTGDIQQEQEKMGNE